ncbi:S1 RNA-binding domain-containing protein [Thermostilla marina]
MSNDQPTPESSRPEDSLAESQAPAQPESPSNEDSNAASPSTDSQPRKRRILIGSQRDPAAYRPRPGKPITPGAKPSVTEDDAAAPAPQEKQEDAEKPVFSPEELEEDERTREVDAAVSRLSEEVDALEERIERETASLAALSPRRGLPADLEAEFEAALEGAELDALVDASVSQTKVGRLEPESRHVGKVLAVHAEDVFIELGLREQGVVPAKMFSEPPQVGDSVEVRVVRFRPDEGLYELSLPAAAADVGDWGDLEEGMLVEAKVTGTNSGGLECEVNHIRGFIPISQIDLYRVEKTDEYVGQSFTCLVVECNPQRKNLVLSRRAVLEREKEQAEKLLWDSLAPGQVREGVVRRLTDFGAFVDIGGVDGLLHVSQMGWGRIKHPSEVVQEGQTIRVRVDKVDRDARRISLSYRDMAQDPWLDVERKYPINSAVRGKVVKIMEFGAFVELEPGVEGLVHISELANKRVWRVSDVVSEGDEVDVAVLSIDKEQRRISLSMKSLLTAKEAPQQDEAAEEEPPAPEPAQKVKRKPQGPLKGGLGRSAGSAGERFGLKW